MSSKSDNGGQPETAPVPESANGRAAAIAQLAFEKWTARGCPDGDDQRDWYDAEREISAAMSSQSAASAPARSRKGSVRS
jgi:hypothetical protein